MLAYDICRSAGRPKRVASWAPRETMDTPGRDARGTSDTPAQDEIGTSPCASERKIGDRDDPSGRVPESLARRHAEQATELADAHHKDPSTHSDTNPTRKPRDQGSAEADSDEARQARIREKNRRASLRFRQKHKVSSHARMCDARIQRGATVFIRPWA
jgi:hypothetical protein